MTLTLPFLEASDVAPNLALRHEVELLEVAMRGPEVWRGRGRVEVLDEPGSFRVVCDCTSEPTELARVEGAEATLWSWHLRHAWGGTAHLCGGCGGRYAYSGLIGPGEPGALDVVDAKRIDTSSGRYSPLSRIQAHLLDVALERDDAVWLSSVDLISEAKLLEQPT